MHIYELEIGDASIRTNGCIIRLKTDVGELNSTLGEFDFLNGFGCDLNAEGVRFEQYLKTGTGQEEFKTVKI